MFHVERPGGVRCVAGAGAELAERRQLVLDVVQQILGVALQLAGRGERQALAKTLGRALVQVARRQRVGAGAAALDLVRGELVAPAERVPQARIFGPGSDSAFDQCHAFFVLRPSRDQRCGEMFERLGEVWVEFDRTPRRRDRLRGIARLVRCERLIVCGAGVVVRAQVSPSTSFSASFSVNTRNEFVRTLPWLLTASDTRVIDASSGASAITT